MADIDTASHLIASAGLAQRVAALIAPAVADMGYELVRVQITGERGRTLRIMAERPDGTMVIEDCEALSRVVSALLDVEDPIQGNYQLEVSSPGLARPLTRPKDFETWAGFEAKIELSTPLAGQRRFRGVLDGFEQNEVRLETEVPDHETPQVIGLPFDLIGEAKLVMNDALIRGDLKAADEKLKRETEKRA